jgi:trans-2,3-dihydro-3-hydroxyanthranilate isomerase
MRSYEFVTVDVFTTKRFGGNPLAVFPDATGLSGAEMQAIAAEFNLSETSFVLPPDNPQHHARVRIFTPRVELPFAGHPNVGTGFVLGRQDQEPPGHYVFEEGAGLVRVHLLREEGEAVTGARISAPHSLNLGIGIPPEVIAGCLGLPPDSIETTGHGPIVASVGVPFVIAELRDERALAAARPDLAAFRNAAAEYPVEGGQFGLHLYVRLGGDATRLRARMFAPLGGVMEDPATGSANAALAALLSSIAPGNDVDLTYEIAQGVEMGRPSEIIATARKVPEGPVLATVSGSCVPVMRGTIELS